MRIVKNISFVFLSFILVFFAGKAIFAHAQFDASFLTNPGAIRDNDIDVEISPEVPGPNQNVRITLSSYSTNINKASISWNINGKDSISGTGKTTFSFTTGDIGSKTEVNIVIIVAEGSRIDKKITIQPSQVDLLWEAPDSYVSPFYKGKAMASQESKVNVVALPIESNGSIIPGNKVYSWKKKYTVDQTNSGYGKYSYIVKNSYLDQSDIVSVNVSSQSGSGSVGTLNLNYVKPQIMFYENNPALGLKLNKLLNTGFSLPSGEMTIRAEPFYFSKNKSSVTGKNMEYKWKINGTNVPPPEKPNELTIRGNNQAGLATISLDITNIITLFQEVKQTVSVTLGK